MNVDGDGGAPHASVAGVPRGPTSVSSPTAPYSQTLDRGVRVLELLAAAGRPLVTGDLAHALEVHRSIAYRILRTLEDHRLVQRASDGGYELGVGVSLLARAVSLDLQTAALPELSAMANELEMTAFLVVRDGEHAVTLTAVEPRSSAAHVAYRPGARHPVERGAPGLALLAGAAPQPGERPEVARARRQGYALSRGEVIPGLCSIAAPVSGWGVLAAVAVVYVHTDEDEAVTSTRVMAAAGAIGTELG